ncbi:phosphotransferase family protein [Streptomyces sp. NPDC059095]|uniref:phosphotransferase family protein n=1 Tax=Streptomyces sp. NPDC059095 TaxID=3346726 RepID=UPI003683BFF7
MDTQTIFGDVLRAELGSPTAVRSLSSSPRSQVWRVELPARAQARPRQAVVKHLVDGPGAEERYARELAALGIAARSPTPVVPRLLATDPERRLLVLDHLDHHTPAPDWIVHYAESLARLHATAAPEDAGLLPRRQGPGKADIAAFLALAVAIGAAVPAGVRDELEALVGRLDRAPGHALLHGDPCPGNDLHTVEGVRFVDFEQASLGSGLMELAYLRIGFPTCWCVTAAAEPLLARAERAYLTAWRAATGSELRTDGLVDACVGWLIRGDALVQRAHRDGTDHLARIPEEDWTWGTASARQRLLHRLGVVGALTAGDPVLGAVHALTASMRDRMLARWPALRPVPTQRP